MNRDNLRKCKVKCWNRDIKEYEYKIGYFHEWGVEYENYDEGVGNYSIGIVEFEDGSVDTFVSRHIQFI